MATPQTIAEILAATLQALESLAHQKLADGDFDEVTRVASAASTIRCQMLRDPNSQLNTPSTEALDDGDSVVSATTGEARRRKSAARRRPRGYPRFYKDDDRLVKVGWSKKNRCAYEHRAGKDAVYAVLDAIRHRLSNRRTFKVEDLSGPTSSGPKNAEVPQYVQYLVVAWLESCDILEKNGRDGYSKNASGLAGRTNADLWHDIPARTNNA